jgi:carbon-monoxide dehydrogenase medium subunit
MRAVSKLGERLIPLKDFFTGVKTTCCGPCDLITEILVPSDKTAASGFLKRTRIHGHDLAIVNGAARVGDGGGLRLALGAVAPAPMLLDEFDGVGLDDRRRIIETALKSISPIDDVRGSSRYREYMVEYLVDRLLDTLSQRMERA